MHVTEYLDYTSLTFKNIRERSLGEDIFVKIFNIQMKLQLKLQLEMIMMLLI